MPEPKEHETAEGAVVQGTGRALESRTSSATPEWWNDGGNEGRFPKTEEQARSHIEWIRKDKKLDRPDSNAIMGDAMLKESMKVHTDSTHFLFELLQNADDNSYDTLTPTMKVTYREGNGNRGTCLRIDCNEIGFNSANVQSICSLAISSKRTADVGTDHIGEKGVGFKSVFKVAKAVWISSGYYSFKFVNDESKILSLVAPHWAKFPDHERSRPSGYKTSILLELFPEYDSQPLVRMLKSMKADIMLFLRKLKVVRIKVIGASGSQPHEISLERLHDIPTQDGMSLFTVRKGNDPVSYSVFRFEVLENELPSGRRRKGFKASHILLAFPTEASGIWSNHTQQVYAFLPVRNYGLNFILQADFLLTTGRESIEQCLWNKVLIAKIPYAFLGAVQEFIKQGSSSWLSYIPLGEYRDSLFQGISEKSIELLSKMSILESRGEELLRPSELTMVPSKFRDDSGQPFIPSGFGRTKYLSEQYPAGSENALTRLGVTKLSEEAFLLDLEAFISADQAAFQRMDPKFGWHSQVSTALISMITQENSNAKTYCQKISKLKLVPVSGTAPEAPLHECSWIASNQGKIFFPGGGLHPPRSLGIFEVHGEVPNDSSWIILLKILNVEQYNKQKICDIIVRRHSDPAFRPEDLTPEDLISHIVFLKRAFWRPAEGTEVDLWFVTADGSYHRGSSIYVDMVSPKVPLSATVVFEDRSRFHFLDGNYESTLSPYDKGHQPWLVWLIRNFGLTVLPRMALVTNARAGEVRLTPDFQFLVDTDPVAVLQLLQQWWKYYRWWVVGLSGSNSEEVKPNAESRERIKAVISSMKVPCEGGGIAQLRQTFLPRKSVILGLKISTSLHEEGLAAVVESLSPPASKPMLAGEGTKGPSNQPVAIIPTTAETATPTHPPLMKLKSSFFSLLRKLFRRGPKKDAAIPAQKLVEEPTSTSAVLPPELALDVHLPTSRPAGSGDLLKDGNNTTHEPESTIAPAKPNSELLLKIPDPEEKSWDFLEDLGVIVRIRVEDCLVHLRQLKSSDGVTRASVVPLYENVEQCAEPKDFEIVRKAFVTEDLVFIPLDEGKVAGGRWTSLESCVWDGPDCLRRTPRVKKFYESRFKLFLEILKCPTAELPVLVQEAQRIDGTSDLQHIASVFAAISGCRDLDRCVIAPLKELEIFPTRQGLGKTGNHKLRTALDSHEWYIPDKPRSAQVFSDKDFLAFPSTSWNYFKILFELLDIQHRLISIAVEHTLSLDGDVQPALLYEKWLKRRIPFVAALVPSTTPDRNEILVRLQHNKVLQAERVTIRWTIKKDSVSTTTREQNIEIGQVALAAVGEEELQLCMATPVSETNTTLEQIATELSEFCGITNTEHISLLKYILTEQNRKDIGNRLRSHDILFELTDPEDGLDIDELPSTNEIPTIEYLPIVNERPAADELPATDENLTKAQIPSEDDSANENEMLNANGEGVAVSRPEQVMTVPGIVVSEASMEPSSGPRLGILSDNTAKPNSAQAPSLEGKSPEQVEQAMVIPEAMSRNPENETEETKLYLEVGRPSSPAGEGSSSTSEGGVKPETGVTVPGQGTDNKIGWKSAYITRQQMQKAQTISIDEPQGLGPAEIPQAATKVSRTHASYSSGPEASHKDYQGDISGSSDQESIGQRRSDTSKLRSPHRGRSLAPQRDRESSPSTQIFSRGDWEESRSRPRSRDEYMNMNRGWMTVPTPMTIFSGGDTKQTKFFGELYVSRYLQLFFKEGFYDPDTHWTSALRSRNGHTTFNTEEGSGFKPFSTFTITETSGKLRDKLTSGGHIHLDVLENTVTFHLEVCATNGELSAGFTLPNSQLKKLKEMSLKKNKMSKDVYILVRVYKVYEDPGIAMYVDPWKLYLNDSISLDSESDYQGHVSKLTRAILVDNFVSAGLASETHEIYKDLNVEMDQIRLLRLEPEDDDDKPLKGSLIRADLRKVPKFWAISYVWGPKPDGPSPSTFETEQGKINITESLASCLRSLRRQRVTALIWADALCINQKHDIEKSMQVRRMGSLYQEAERVIIWMGDRGSEKERNPVLDWLASIHQPFCKSTGRCHTGKGPSMANSTVPDEDDIIWEEVDRFLERDWFTRTWIVQELVLSSDVTIKCGKSEIQWDCFMESLLECANGLTQGYGRFVDDSGSRFLAHSAPALALHRTRLKYKDSKKSDFLSLLEDFSYTTSSKARDKLFALQNMASDVDFDDSVFVPVYAGDDEPVLENYARGFVQKHRALDLLYRAGVKKASGFCSWIPNFIHRRGLQEYPSTISTWKAGRDDFFHAGKHTLFRARVQEKDQNQQLLPGHPAPALKIIGYIIDEVEGCFPLQISTGSRDVTFAQALRDMRAYTSYLTDYPGLSREDLADSETSRANRLMLSILTGDARGPQNVSNRYPLSSRQETQPARSATTWNERDLDGVLNLELDQDARKYKEKATPGMQSLIMQFWHTAAAFTGRIPDAAFSTTKKRYAGIVPGAAQEGDVIFIADGAAVPFVLRKKPGTAHYTLIGECYIHGIMYFSSSYVEEMKVQEQEISIV